MSRTTRKANTSRKEANNEKLKAETLKEEQLFKSLPRDLQWEILTEFLQTHVVRKGRLMRRLTGEVQQQLLESMPQKMPMRMRQPLRLNLKSLPMKVGNKNEWTKHFDHLGLQGSRSLSVVEDSNGNPAYRYVSRMDGKDEVDITTPIENTTALAPYVKHNYTSYNGVRGNITSKARLYDPKKVSTGYRPSA
jgi:hypothetical protein